MTTRAETIIKTDRLILRPFEKSDLDQVLSYYSLPDVQRYIEWKSRDDGEAKAAFDMLRKQTRLTRPGNYLGLPAVCAVAGFTRAGMPSDFFLRTFKKSSTNPMTP